MPFVFDPNAKDTTSIIIGRGQTIKQAREKAGKQSSSLLTPGKINLELYGKDTAKAGLRPFINTLIRDARVPDMMQLAVSNLTARELLEFEQENISVNTAEYLQDLLEKEVKQDNLPRNTLEYFTRLGEQVGIEPILPLLDIVEDQPTITGAAVFQNDRLVDEISLKESFLVNQLRKKVTGTPLDAEIPLENYLDKISAGQGLIEKEDSIYIALSLSTGKGKIKLIDENQLKFKIDVSMRVQLIETSLLIDIKTEAVNKRLEKDLEEYFKSEYEKLFIKLQEANSDVIGLGRVYAATRNGSRITNEEWAERFPETSAEFEVNVTMINLGTVD